MAIAEDAIAHLDQQTGILQPRLKGFNNLVREPQLRPDTSTTLNDKIKEFDFALNVLGEAKRAMEAVQKLPGYPDFPPVEIADPQLAELLREQSESVAAINYFTPRGEAVSIKTDVTKRP